MPVTGSGGGEAGEDEVEGRGPFPLLLGEHHLGTCWKSQFSSSIQGRLKGLAVTAGTPGGKLLRISRW